MHNSNSEYLGESISRGNIPKDLWFLLQYATNGDFERIKRIKSKIEKNGKKLIPVYPGVSELMKGVDVSKMELIGSIIDGALYLK
ncbi:hypothetical protein [Bacteroides sp. 224]|uniref:hypothetical protein n=1 Tax=Bacteroides sp. 224 TaxID=2302936 RepID=UPI0013D3D2EF|nr:hypothetical protein [Bacteroides sp. 224]NDV63776.1 hypothetical protein [Bacteroides sp. 224]